MKDCQPLYSIVIIEIGRQSAFAWRLCKRLGFAVGALLGEKESSLVAMFLKRCFAIVLVLLAVTAGPLFAQPDPGDTAVAPGGPYSVAILDFDTGGRHFSYNGSSLDPEKAIPAILTTQLANCERFVVVEREQLEAVLNEQKLGASGAITAETAASIGEVLGVSYLIVGNITELTVEEGQSKGFSAFGISSSSKGANKAKVSIELKVLDTESARVVAAVTCRKTFEIGKGSHSSNVLGIGNRQSGDKSDKSGMVDTYYAIAEDLASQLSTVKFRALPPKVKFTGFVALIDSGHYYINLGQKDGIKKKMVFKVYREAKKAGITVKVNVAEIQAVNVDTESTECVVLNQTSNIKGGDLIESKF